jgi:hypothetical protein
MINAQIAINAQLAMRDALYALGSAYADAGMRNQQIDCYAAADAVSKIFIPDEVDPRITDPFAATLCLL